MPTPSGVNNLLQFLQFVSDNFADFQMTRIKSGCSPVMSLLNGLSYAIGEGVEGYI